MKGRIESWTGIPNELVPVTRCGYRVAALSLGLFVTFIFAFGQEARAQGPVTGRVIAYYAPDLPGHLHSLSLKYLESHGLAKKIDVLLCDLCEPAPNSRGEIVPRLVNPEKAYLELYTSGTSVDGIADAPTQRLRGQLNQLKELKAANPKMKILISIGGPDAARYFSKALSSEQSRSEFVNAIVNEFILGNLKVRGNAGGKGVAAGIFDGVDIDWAYPPAPRSSGGLNIADSKTVMQFYALLRSKLNAVSPHLLLTTAVPADRAAAGIVDVREDQQYVNWFELTTYDFTGPWNSTTGFEAGLFNPPAGNAGRVRSFSSSIEYFIDSLGVRRSKIVPGVSSCGQVWDGVDSTDAGMYQHAGIAMSVGKPGCSHYSGLEQLEHDGYAYHWDAAVMAPWLYNPSTKILWSFDGPKSAALKARYVQAYHLGGIMISGLTADGSSQTLLRALYTGDTHDVQPGEAPPGLGTPSVRIILPRGRNNFVAGSNVILKTAVADRNGQVIKVEFFVDGRSIGFDTIPPFDWVWFNIPRGTHTITAIATDSIGNSSRSRKVRVTVGNDDPRGNQ